MNCLIVSPTGKRFLFTHLRTDGASFQKHKYLQWAKAKVSSRSLRASLVPDSAGVKDMTHEARAKAKAKDLTCHAALKPQTLYTVPAAPPITLFIELIICIN